ncbi:MAG: helix-turn-helix domain-containing protein, partial [Cohnella sp.]|nr:helix-turn-helix domain-containing protein [Cohnella sp.]
AGRLVGALDLMRHRFFLESETVSTAESGTPFAAHDPDVGEKQALDGEKAAQKLYLALDIGSRDSIVQQVEETAETLIELGCGEAEFKSEFVQLLSVVLDKLTASRPEFNTREFRARLLELYTELHYRSFLHRIVGILADIGSSIDSSSSRSHIARMIDLIHRNYRENLKLEKLAELFNYNSAYLGKLFKSETGEHFNTYLDKVRIEHAKTLLEQGMKVYQVAEKVGYANVDYFHAKFRKYEGVSPSAYKKK